MREALRNLINGRIPSSCVVIAEIGVNHNGSFDRALALLDSAARAGADAVKLQLFQPSELCSALHRRDEQRLLQRLRLSDDDHARLVAAADKIGLPVFATPFDRPSLDLLCRLGIPVVKIGSGEITHTPFLADVARTRKPVILSTGACNWGDVDRAVDMLRGNCRDLHLSLLHCTSAYPPPDEQVNLRIIPEIAARYPHLAVGFSDHTLSHDAALAAVALGARIIEKHLTLDRADEGPDHAASADPADFARLVRSVRRIESMLGLGLKRVQPCEGTIGRSIVAAFDLPAGHRLSSSDFAYKRPGRGIRPWDAARLVGRQLRRHVPADDLITLEDLEPLESGRFVAWPADAPVSTA